ncbi:hypothetical protein BVX98_07655 [bacterium F11]|nr:hypothetical protein BVX98_07655 [bacterium F11]
MEETAITIDVKNLTKFYSHKPHSIPALKDITFQVKMGGICCLLGPNGSGKTTLLKILAGLLTPTSGEISMMGFDPFDQPHKIRQLIGWMPAEERSGLYGRLTGNQNLEFFSSLYGMKPQDLDRRLGNLGLLLGFKKELDQKMLEASAGNRQKLGLARVLLHDPTLLLLDEPFRNLDPHTVRRFRRLLKDHLTRNQQKTVILSTHQLEEAKRVADSLIILHRGRIVRTLSALEMKKELNKHSLEDYYMRVIDKEPA